MKYSPRVTLADLGRGVVVFLRCWGPLAAALALGAVATAEDVPRSARGLEVLVAADASPAAENFRPQPGKPVHYLLGQTQQSLGERVAGIKVPPPGLIERAVVAELARQGYVRTGEGGPVPQLFIMAVVGDANFKEEPSVSFDDLDFRDYAYQVNLRALLERNGLGHIIRSFTLEEIMEENPITRNSVRIDARELLRAEARRLRYSMSQRARDQGKIASLIGMEKVSRAVEQGAMNRFDADQLARAAADDMFYLTLTAFDVARRAQGQRVLLWRTTMLVDWRKDLAKELPTMLAQAGPVFGKDQAYPNFVDERDRKQTEVTIGNATVLPGEKKAGDAKKK